MYYILDLQKIPYIKVPGLNFENELDACQWIDNNGDAVKYTIIEE